MYVMIIIDVANEEERQIEERRKRGRRVGSGGEGEVKKRGRVRRVEAGKRAEQEGRASPGFPKHRPTHKELNTHFPMLLTL